MRRKRIRIPKVLFVFVLLINLVPESLADLAFFATVDFTTGYYHKRGEPFPQDVKECLYEIYRDREHIDNLRYIIDHHNMLIAPGAPILAKAIGNTIVYSYDAFDSKEFYGFNMRLHIHETWHTFQFKYYGAIPLLLKVIRDSIDKGGYGNTWIERNAIASEQYYFRYCMHLHKRD